MACDGVVEKPRAEEQQNESVDLQLRFLGERTNERSRTPRLASLISRAVRDAKSGAVRDASSEARRAKSGERSLAFMRLRARDDSEEGLRETSLIVSLASLIARSQTQSKASATLASV